MCVDSPKTEAADDDGSAVFWSVIDAVGSTTSVMVSAVFAAVLVYQRDALMVSFFIGAISNGVLSKVLKKLLNQSRPEELDAASMKLKPSDGGMPSSHAMSLGFIGTFTFLNLPWTTVPLLTYNAVSLIYRVRTKLHTREQIVAGFLVGTLNGFLWWYLCVAGISLPLPVGTTPYINVMDWVSRYILNEQGLLPWPLLAIPAITGAMVVGSFERRISTWIKQRKERQD